MSRVDLGLLEGRRLAVVSFSAFPGDPRPRRAAEACSAMGMQVEVICLRGDGETKRESFRGIEIDRIAIKKSRSSKIWYVLQYCFFLGAAFMKLAGEANWWAPAPLRRWHDRYGLNEGDGPEPFVGGRDERDERDDRDDRQPELV